MANLSWAWEIGPAESDESDHVGEGEVLYVHSRSSCQSLAGMGLLIALTLMGEWWSKLLTSMGEAALLDGG